MRQGFTIRPRWRSTGAAISCSRVMGPEETRGPPVGASPEAENQPETWKIQRGGSWRFHAGLCRSTVCREIGVMMADDTPASRLAVVAMN